LWNGKWWRMVSSNGCLDTTATTIGTVTELEERKEATSRNAKKGMGQHGTSRTTNDGMAKLPFYVCTVCYAKPMVRRNRSMQSLCNLQGTSSPEGIIMEELDAMTRMSRSVRGLCTSA